MHTVRAAAASVADSSSWSDLLHGQSWSCWALKRTGRRTIESFLRSSASYRIQSTPHLRAALCECWRMISRAALADLGRAGEHAFRLVKQLWASPRCDIAVLSKNLARAF